jgi:hypothetical protein
VTTVRADDELLHPSIGTASTRRDGAIGSLWVAGIALALAAGIVFRLMLPGDIEFHGDEKFAFDHVMTVLNGGPWPLRGMVMSVEIGRASCRERV